MRSRLVHCLPVLFGAALRCLERPSSTLWCLPIPALSAANPQPFSRCLSGRLNTSPAGPPCPAGAGIFFVPLSLSRQAFRCANRLKTSGSHHSHSWFKTKPTAAMRRRVRCRARRSSMSSAVQFADHSASTSETKRCSSPAREFLGRQKTPLKRSKPAGPHYFLLLHVRRKPAQLHNR